MAANFKRGSQNRKNDLYGTLAPAYPRVSFSEDECGKSFVKPSLGLVPFFFFDRRVTFDDS